MKQYFRSPFPLLVPTAAVAALLALLIFGFTARPSTGWGAQYASVNERFQVENQFIQTRFHDGNANIERMNPADSAAIKHARSAVMDQYQKDSNANNLRWQADIRQVNHTALLTETLTAIACLLLGISVALFVAKFYYSNRTWRKPVSA